MSLTIAVLVKIICNPCLGNLAEAILKRQTPKLCTECTVKTQKIIKTKGNVYGS